ncbi:MAG: glycogen/starch/alpha-glucan phosphorylase [Myxococcales bacterium]|nr:MAG: glycogen/starch/alpha-glucan phosphorylase [Myxococcales bacterium]
MAIQRCTTRSLRKATPHDRYVAWALLVRDRVVQRWIATHQAYRESDAKFVAYLSAEFLMGRMLRTNLVNLELLDSAKTIAHDLGIDLEHIYEEEPDAGLGNGGLGRLAACFLDSMATLALPAFGYGIRYEFGIFRQAIRGGYQIEKPDEWLRFGNPWEFARPEHAVQVRFGGRVERHLDARGHTRVRWVDTQNVLGVPYDTPIIGYGRGNVNTLRLWSARSSEEFDLDVFNAGDYEKAVYDKTRSETISKVLYPNDSVQVGRELRLRQQYFFVACSIADIIDRYRRHHATFDEFPNKMAIQLNDTHPSVAIPELMRVLVDEHDLPWEKAWSITQATFAYTNHTLMSEALERWSVELFERLLPRHLEIIYEINTRFLRAVQIQFPGDTARIQRMSLIEENPAGKNVRMANLSVVGAHSINGVSELHTQLLRSDVLHDFAEMYPQRFNNKTNGVTPRRWLLECNPRLSALLDESIGKGWVTDLDRLAAFKAQADRPETQQRMGEIKAQNKVDFARYLAESERMHVDPKSIFDVQIKRLHEYKRQLLNILSVTGLFLRHRRTKLDIPPLTVLFGGKAAPGYRNAKLIIRLIHGVAEVINEVPGVSPIAVHFVPNYRVSLAERMIPATDISEQISTAGFEASGTGNMKFALNGALTLGTLDGANIEIRDSVGPDAFFLFGMTAEEVRDRKAGYRPADIVRDDPELAEVLDMVKNGFFSPEDKTLFHDLIDGLMTSDPYMVLADYRAYQEARLQALGAYRDQAHWQQMAIRNVAGSGPFSADRTIREYAREIWSIDPVPVEVPVYSPE